MSCAAADTVTARCYFVSPDEEAPQAARVDAGRTVARAGVQAPQKLRV